MRNKHRKASHDEEHDTESRDAGTEKPVTLAKGGMSPLADRKDPKDWAKSVDAAPATDRPDASQDAAKRTPKEPVGGWVDASTGRGKILVPEGGKLAASATRATDERSPMRLIKAKETGAAAAGSVLAKGRTSKEKEAERNAAEAGAAERQEEDRNQQDATQDEEEDEEDEETDDNA